jgi:hypothetical protein
MWFIVLNCTSTLQVKLYFPILLQHRKQLLNKLLYVKGDPLPLSCPHSRKTQRRTAPRVGP